MVRGENLDKPDTRQRGGCDEGPVCLWGVFGVSLGFAAAFSSNHIAQPGQRPQVLGSCNGQEPWPSVAVQEAPGLQPS